MSAEKPILQSDSNTQKSYGYALGSISLKFTLRNDIKTEMQAFLELMARATEDVTNDLNAMK